MPNEGDIKTNSFAQKQSKNPLAGIRPGKTLHSLLDGTFLAKGMFVRALPFIIFLMVLGVFYISNIFKVESTKRQIDDLEEELRELRYEYITSRSKLMFESKPSEIVIKLKDTGIGESMDPPKKIMVSKEEKKQ